MTVKEPFGVEDQTGLGTYVLDMCLNCCTIFWPAPNCYFFFERGKHLASVAQGSLLAVFKRQDAVSGIVLCKLSTLILILYDPVQ